MVLCSKNKRDIDEIDEHYLKGITVHFVDTVDDVMEVALMKDKVANPLKFILPENDK